MRITARKKSMYVDGSIFLPIVVFNTKFIQTSRDFPGDCPTCSQPMNIGVAEVYRKNHACAYNRFSHPIRYEVVGFNNKPKVVYVRRRAMKETLVALAL
jgi:hypothetical protein